MKLVAFCSSSWGTIAYKPPFTDPRKHAVFDDAFTTDAGLSRNIEVVMGIAEVDEPLFRADQPWEFRMDNGFPSVIYDISESPSYKLWYHAFFDCKRNPPECHPEYDNTGMLYAESDDGRKWRKPSFSFSKIPGSDYGATSNVVWPGGYAFGLLKDPQEVNQSRVYKAFGRLKQPIPGKKILDAEAGGVIVSGDGIHWTDPLELPLRVRWDTHHSILWHGAEGRYVLVSLGPRSSMVISSSALGSFTGFSSLEVIATPIRADDNIISAQVFAYYGVYLAFITTSSDTCSLLARYPCHDRLRCQLAWSADLRHWKRFRSEQWQFQETPANFGRLNYSSRGFDEVVPLQVDSFYSHRCFAAKPVEIPGEGTRIYFIGGNDRHQTSLGLARLRVDGLIGVRAMSNQVGRLMTKPLVVLGDGILISAEIEEGGSIQVQVLHGTSLELRERTLQAEATRPRHTSLFASLDDHLLLGNEALADLIGTEVRLSFRLYRARLYTFSFKDPLPLKSSLQRDVALVWPVLSKVFLFVIVVLSLAAVGFLAKNLLLRRSASKEARGAVVIGRPLD